MMNSNLRFGLVLCVILVLFMQNAYGSMTRAPRNNDISTMADALKYLQDLDTYYGDRARVRFGKRASLAQIWHNRLMENPEAAHNAEYPPAEDSF